MEIYHRGRMNPDKLNVVFNIDKFVLTRGIEAKLGTEYKRIFVGAYFYARKIDGNVEIWNKTMDVLVTKVPEFSQFIPTTIKPRRKPCKTSAR